jgi:hypothetical protein
MELATAAAQNWGLNKNKNKNKNKKKGYIPNMN